MSIPNTNKHHSQPGVYSIREFADDIAAAASLFHAGNTAAFHAALKAPAEKIVARDDLLECGLPRSGNNVAESYYLYFDGDMSIVLFKVPRAPAVQPHDH